jgi:hypothetical protein
LPVYGALSFLNSPERRHTRVLSLGNELRLYTTAQIEGNAGSPEAASVLRMASEQEVLSFLKSRGYEYILINRTNTQKIPGAGKILILGGGFLEGNARAEFAENNFFVYRINPRMAGDR